MPQTTWSTSVVEGTARRLGYQAHPFQGRVLACARTRAVATWVWAALASTSPLGVFGLGLRLLVTTCRGSRGRARQSRGSTRRLGSALCLVPGRPALGRHGDEQALEAASDWPGPVTGGHLWRRLVRALVRL